VTSRLTFVCHASTSALRVAAFPDDESIEAERTHRLECGGFGRLDVAWSAPERRTTETAAVLSLSVPVLVDSELRDCDYGRWKGRRLEEVEAVEPEAIASWIQEPDRAPHGGESLVQLIARVSNWMDARMNNRGRFLAVTHPSIIRAAIIHTLNAPPTSFWRINIDPFSLTDISLNNGRWTLRSVGRSIEPAQPLFQTP